MKLNFNNILDEQLYKDTKVVVTLSKYPWFVNMISDTLKEMSKTEVEYQESISLEEEFGVYDSDEDINDTSVNFNTFIDVIGVANINGKWFCKVDYNSLTAKQVKTLLEYIKNPSSNGVLVIAQYDWKSYKTMYSQFKKLNYSNDCHIISLDWPNSKTMKAIIKQFFENKGYEIEPAAIDTIIIKMSNKYDEYENQLNDIVHRHEDRLSEIEDSLTTVITHSEVKDYMRNIQYFNLDDFMDELLFYNEANNGKVRKKAYKMLEFLQEETSAEQIVSQLYTRVSKYIEYRMLINSGVIPIGINYFFNDVMKDLKDRYGENNPYKDINEFVFRKNASIASQTSLRDWQNMLMILNKCKGTKSNFIKDKEFACKKALIELLTRNEVKTSTLNKVLGIQEIKDNCIDDLNMIHYEKNTVNN